MPRNGKPEQLPATVAYDEKRKQALKCQGSNHAESIAAMASAWLRRNVRQVCDGGPRCRIMYLETVDSAVSNPSFSSSPWMRGAPHKGFSLLCVPTTPSVLITRPNRLTSAAMIALFCLCLSLFASPIKSKSRLEAENAALRYQLIVLKRRVRGRVQLTNGDRLFLVQLYRWFPSVLKAITIIRPETISSRTEVGHGHRSACSIGATEANPARL